MKNILILIFLSCTISCAGQSQMLRGTVLDSNSLEPVAGATIRLLPSRNIAATNDAGNFVLNSPGENKGIQVSAIGYASQTMSLTAFRNQKNIFRLNPAIIQLSAVTISPKAGGEFQALSKIDIALRDVSNAQEVLRLVPGLFIGQHQGGGKAEQIFLRGFDCDHGTDVGLYSDGMPVNLVSHAHGQGYADTHFIIPETIESVNFRKGPYYAEKGDFCTTGYVDYHTMNVIPENMVKVEAGMFNTFRVLAMTNLLSEKAKQNQQSWYAAAEYRYTDSYFDNPQHFNRFNFFTKYNGKINANTWMNFSASAMYSKWNASGQIPERAVSEGLIGYYGSIDPNEGGVTSRINANLQTLTTLQNGDVIKNQLYYSYYNFELYSNFTFYLTDTVNGDEIRQKEARNFFGYRGNYEHSSYLGSAKLNSEIGLDFRGDATGNSELSHTMDRHITLQNLKLGNITEFSFSPYLNETIRFSERFSMNAGLRFDQFYYQYNNKLASDTLFKGVGTYNVKDNSINPKLGIYYYQNENLEFYLNLGKGFHSNDARSVVAEKGVSSLPGAYGTDLGTVFKPVRNLMINAALWYILLDQEYVYGGDGGTIEFAGKTKRLGFDFSGRYEPFKYVFLELDLNYAYGRAVDQAKGQNFIPLAPVWTSAGGITYARPQGFNGSIHYRYMGDRPANADYSLKAVGYFVTDLVLNYTRKSYELGLAINNLFNTQWKETQFATETRLKGEPAPVTEICFTPGTPFAARLSLTVFFK
jgi:hypothetical protein